MSVKDHYDNHLAGFYEWMTGDFETATHEQQTILENFAIRPSASAKAIDLGCGHGIHSIALANLGFVVYAIDFNELLLQRVQHYGMGKRISIINADILDFEQHTSEAEVILCMGDTIAHLNSLSKVAELLSKAHRTLRDGGVLMLSFRDYETALEGVQRFIPVRSDDERILTCFLEFGKDHVNVTDLLHKKVDGLWQQKVSSYIKLRITVKSIARLLEDAGFQMIKHEVIKRMHYISAKAINFTQARFQTSSDAS